MIHEPQYPASLYEQYRPSFPATIFRLLAEKAPSRRRALDCATGTGKAARELRCNFQQVIAFDHDLEMLRSRIPSPSVSYVNTRAERCGFQNGSFDVIFVGQALHWFASDAYYSEVKRLLAAQGLFAAACYQRPRISSEVDPVVSHLFNEILDGYWHPAVHHLQNAYADLPFPFRSIPAPSYKIVAHWNMSDIFGFLNTWSAVLAYRNGNGSDPLKIIEADMHTAWGNPDRVRWVEWPVHLLMGKA